MRCVVKIVKMNNSEDMDYWGKQDPFIVVEYGNNKHTTPVKNGAGKNPTWPNEQFTYNIGKLSEKVIITATDSDPIWNDLIGKATISAGKLCPAGANVTHKLPIFLANGK